MTITEQREYVAELEMLFEQYGETLVGRAIEIYVSDGLGRPPITAIRCLCSLWMRQLAADELTRRATAEAAR
jgi:hypothetical protein